MKRFTLAKFVLIVSISSLILWGIGACDTSDGVEPDDVTPSPTLAVEAFESPLSPTPTAEALESTRTPTPTAAAFESPILPTATQPPLTLTDGFGGATGVLVTFPPSWDGRSISVFFAPFYPGEQTDEGIFVLEPDIHPRIEAEPGVPFRLESISPGKYVIVVGPTPDEALALRDGERPRVFTILEGEVLEIGEIHLGE